jgi:hypothetical protein
MGDKKFFSDLRKLMEHELIEADKDCFRRRTVIMNLLDKARKEEEVAGLI